MNTKVTQIAHTFNLNLLSTNSVSLENKCYKVTNTNVLISTVNTDRNNNDKVNKIQIVNCVTILSWTNDINLMLSSLPNE
jgi:hypothetical protein